MISTEKRVRQNDVKLLMVFRINFKRILLYLGARIEVNARFDRFDGYLVNIKSHQIERLLALKKLCW